MTQRLASGGETPEQQSVTTPAIGLHKPAVGADADVWGTLWNLNADILDAAVIFDQTSGLWPQQLTDARVIGLDLPGIVVFNGYLTSGGTPHHTAAGYSAQISLNQSPARLDLWLFDTAAADVACAALGVASLDADGSFTVGGRVIAGNMLRAASPSGPAFLHLATSAGAMVIYSDPANAHFVNVAPADADGTPLAGAWAVFDFSAGGAFYPAASLSGVSLWGHAVNDCGLTFYGNDQLAYDGSRWTFRRGATWETWGELTTGNVFTQGHFISYGARSAPPPATRAVPVRAGLAELRELMPLRWNDPAGTPVFSPGRELAHVLPDFELPLPAPARRGGRASYIDPWPLICALINAVRELDQRQRDAERVRWRARELA